MIQPNVVTDYRLQAIVRNFREELSITYDSVFFHRYSFLPLSFQLFAFKKNLFYD